MGNCWSCIEEAICAIWGEEETNERATEPPTICGEEETNVVSSAPERATKPSTVGVAEADPVEAPVASTSMPRNENSYGGEDVFLSHSGKQKNFVRQLYKDLTENRVSCFFDETVQSLPLAEKWAIRIFEEAKKCRVAVLLLSKDFIRSKWPMLELCAFLKAKNSGENSNLKILPLFYKIAPRDLKDPASDTQSEKTPNAWMDIPKEKRIEWEGALREMRGIKGLEFKEGGNKVSFRDQIKKEILKLLLPSGSVILREGQEKVTLPRAQPTYPSAVGLEEPAEEITKMLELENRAEVMVIYGYGGIGKTTLATAVVANLNPKAKGFNYARINLPQDPQTIDLNKMRLLKKIQQQLLKDAFPKYCGGTQIELRDCEDGRENLRQAFQSLPNERAFIFIDNVLLVEDLKELLPDVLEGLSQGSRILLTARDLRVTDLFEERGLPRRSYRVEPLADEHGKKILCNDSIELEQRKDDVNKVLKICRGIPLALKIVGAQFKKQKYRADNCSVLLEALEKGEEIKEEHLSERLFYFVYNNLETSVQEAFLDICSYYGDPFPKRHIEYIVGVNAVAILEEASLITTVPHTFDDDIGFMYYKGEEMLIVHDVILAIGRRSARGTRIVDDEQSLSRAVEDKKVLESTKGVWFDSDTDSTTTYRLAESHLSRMSNSLRALCLGHGSVTGCSSNTFPELRYLHIGEHVPFLPVNSEALPRLAYYVGPIFKGGFKLPKTLRYLWAVDGGASATSGESNPIQTVQNSSLQELILLRLGKMPILLEGIHEFIELKVLSLYYWTEMEELPAQVCQLRSLNKLDILGWDSLKLLPESFSNLTGLTHLDLSNCYMLEGLCASFGKLTSLRYLNLERCKMLTKLPDSFCQLIALESLNLARCEKLTILPDNFGQLTALKDMDLSRCIRLKELPSSVGELRSLQNLYLRNCSELKELPSSLKELTSLEIEGYPSVR